MLQRKIRILSIVTGRRDLKMLRKMEAGRFGKPSTMARAYEGPEVPREAARLFGALRCQGHTFNAMRGRGVSRKDAEEEIGRAFLGCFWETSKQMPDRWPDVLRSLRQDATILVDEPL